MTDLTAQQMIERILQSLEETGKRFQREKKPADAAVAELRTGGSLCRSCCYSVTVFNPKALDNTP
jgi:hypothetical protein